MRSDADERDPGAPAGVTHPPDRALPGSDALLRTLEESDATPAMFWVTDAEGRCVYLSREWYEFTGQTPQSALGFGWLDATHPDDHAEVSAIFAAARERREPFRLDHRVRRRDGQWRWAIDSAAPRFAADGSFQGFVGSVTDVTAGRLAEEMVRESEARFRALFSAIDEGYCLCEMVTDADGRPVDYRFLEANPQFTEMTGLLEPVGRSARELVPGLEDAWVETYGRVAFGGESMRFENGSEAMGRWFDVFATPVAPRGRFALIFKDVTDRRRAEEALRESEASERLARQQAELIAEIVAELEGVDGFDRRARRLAELLVPRVADSAGIESPADGVPTAADGGSGEELSPALCVVPIETGDDAPASLVLRSSDPERRAFTRADLRLARRIADRVGVVFARARVRDEQRRIASRLQQELLPDEVLRAPGVEVAARYAAASGVLEVGGDWYDTLALRDGCLALAVGDVVGHGLEAAASMGRLRTALAALAPHATGPGQMLTWLDAYATGVNGTRFATACCASLDPATGVLRYASAGHPPMLAVTPSGTATWLGEGRSPAFFGAPAGTRPEASVALEAGTLLMLYSDGLVERRRELLDDGLARLRDVVIPLRDEPIDGLCDQVLFGMGVGTAREDDVVVLCLRLR